MSHAVIRRLYAFWSQSDALGIEALVAPSYTIHSDPGDRYEGQTLTHQGYIERWQESRRAFPDLVFSVSQCVHEGDRVAVIWSAVGTHQGDLPLLPATHRRLSFNGQTIYELKAGLVKGHWQVIDRLGFIQQLRPG